MRFNYLKPLIHHCSRINRDFRAHAPIRMKQSLFLGHIFKLVWLFAQKRSARGGYDYFIQVRSFGRLKALKNSRVFAVDGVNFYPLFSRFFLYKLPVFYL